MKKLQVLTPLTLMLLISTAGAMNVQSNEEKKVSMLSSSANSAHEQTPREMCAQARTLIKNNPQQAFDLFDKAAQQGLASAHDWLGFCYENAIGTTQNDNNAFSSYRTAAEAGNNDGIFDLARCYEFGIGTAPDDKRAFQLYKKAVTRGHKRAHYRLGLFYYNGTCTPINDTNDKKAVALFRPSADEGCPAALNMLGLCYERGRGVRQSEGLAAILYKKAYNHLNNQGQHNAEAAYNLGYCYERGIGVPKDLTTALTYYREAANQGFDPDENCGSYLPYTAVMEGKYYHGEDERAALSSNQQYVPDQNKQDLATFLSGL